VRRFRPDVIHLQETLQDYLVPAVPLLMRSAPLVLTVHDHVPHTGSDAQLGVRRDFYRRMLRRRAQAVIVHGETIRREIQEREPQLKDRVWSVAHGALGPDPLPGIESDPGNLLFFGRIEAYKGLGILVDAVRIVQERGMRARLTIAGRGSDLDRHRAAIARLAECSVIDRFIPVDDIALLFQRAAVVAVPYLDGTQSGVAAMAARYGRPVIATRVGSIPEVVRDGVSGLLVEPGDAQQLAAAIERMLSDRPLAAALAAGAERLGATELSWRAIAQDTVSVYRHVSGRADADLNRSIADGAGAGTP
jgi:glycosyltransferase involved in cell wall biosynthesis